MTIEVTTKTRNLFHKYKHRVGELLEKYERLQNSQNSDRLLLQIAIENSIPPGILCRLVLQEKYKSKNLQKSELAEMMKCYHLIDDPDFAAAIRYT